MREPANKIHNTQLHVFWNKVCPSEAEQTPFIIAGCQGVDLLASIDVIKDRYYTRRVPK